MGERDVISFLRASLECSFYLAPRECGLTAEEMYEAAKRADFQQGEIGDALPKVATQYFGRGPRRLLPDQHATALWGILSIPQNPEYRNIDAFDFVYAQLNANVRAMGAGGAQIERNVLVERAIAENIPRLDVEAAVSILVICGQLAEKDDQLRYPSAGERLPLPSEQRRQMVAIGEARRNETRVRAHGIIKDIVARRSDGRLQHAEPLDAFVDALDRLGYRPFRLWWTQTVVELKLINPSSSPMSALVLAAALVEGALTFVVKHARKHDMAVFRSRDFAGEPRTWKIDDLVASAASGSDTAIFDGPTRQRAETLIRTRQRIHAGRMLSDFPDGVPDLRPEEARDAKAVAEQVVRRVLDWLQKFPPSEV